MIDIKLVNQFLEKAKEFDGITIHVDVPSERMDEIKGQISEYNALCLALVKECLMDSRQKLKFLGSERRILDDLPMELYCPFVKKVRAVIVSDAPKDGSGKMVSCYKYTELFDQWGIDASFSIDFPAVFKAAVEEVLAKTNMREDCDDFMSLFSLLNVNAVPYGSRELLSGIGYSLLMKMQGEYEKAATEAFQKNHLVYTMDGDRSEKAYTSRRALLDAAAEIYCFADCCPVSIEEIVANGEKVHYAGWQPGMLYEFVNEQGETVYSETFPEWDH